MKNYLALIAIVSISIISFAFNAENPINRIGVSGPLVFNKSTFNLVWSDKPNDTYFVQEYLPSGEKLNSFNQMLTINVFDKDIAVEDAAAQKGKWLNERKKTDKHCNFQITNNPDKTEYMVDFIVSESKGDDLIVVEFNIYRYVKVDLGNGKKGILVYVYSKRSYGDAITDFLQNLADDRIDLLNAMIASETPKITLTDK